MTGFRNQDDRTPLFPTRVVEAGLARPSRWRIEYNTYRPHDGLNGQTPYERLKQKTAKTLDV